MNIGNKYLRSWLRFDESATKDFIADNRWTTSGNPTISETNAISGKALQLDGSSYLKLSGVELAGRPFTIDCVAYVNSSSPNNARLFSIIDPTTGHHLASVRKSATQSNYIDTWANSYADCSQDNGYTTTVNAITGVNNRVHVALVYYPDYTSSLSRLLICVGGYVYTINSTKSPKYNRNAFDIVIGALPNGNRGLIGAIDEFRIYDGVAHWTNEYGNNFTPPDASFYSNTHYFYTDAIRMPSIPASEWRYDNIGEIDTLINTTTAVQLTNLPASQSKTGKAFYQTTRTKIFDVSSSKEVWVKFDVYFDGVNRWRAYDISTGSSAVTGVTAQTDGTVYFFNRNSPLYGAYDGAKINSLQTVILHMIADSTNGLIEAYTDDGGLLYAYTGEVNNGTNFGNLYLQSDGSGTFFSSIEISNSPLWFNEKYLYSKIDAIRMPKVPATLWKYENAGTITDLINTNTAVQVDNLPQTQSKTGSAFYQTTDNIAIFDIATNTPEIWIKFDVYSQSYGWYVWDCTNYTVDGSNTGLMVFHQNSSETSSETVVRVFKSNDNSDDVSIDCIDGQLRTFVLHMKADSTDGLIEVYSDNIGLIYEYVGAVNSGTAFSKIDFISEPDQKGVDLFSNVVISNNPLWFYDNVSADISVNFSADAQRELLKSLLLSFDAERQIVGGSIQQNFYVDAQRQIVIPQVIEFDTERSLIAPVELVCDTTRLIKNVVTTQVDTEIIFSYYLEVSFDISRVVVFVISVAVDCEREIFATVDIDCDTFRKLVRNIVVPVYVPPEYIPPSHESPVFPRPEDNSVIQNCTISMQEQQLTDNISFTYAAHVNIMDAVNLQFLDYVINGRVEGTTTKGILESCHLTCDVDEILYRQLAYEVPEDKFEWTDEYKQAVNEYNSSHEKQVDKLPSAPASAHITEIASKLGKNISLHFTDFISTMSTKAQSGTNYSGLISELFGWTSRIPHFMINVFMRGNTIYVIQRGHEQNTIIIDNLKLAVPTIKRKLVRMTWGSEPWSKTIPKSKTNTWTEYDLEPWDWGDEDEGEGGAATYTADNLVRTTTVEHEDETVVTTYKYTEMGDGQKFLSKETSQTYVNNELVDTVVTTHEPVSRTQAHVYATDDDGVIGGVVSASNFDDRETPYQQMAAADKGAWVSSDGKPGIPVMGADGKDYLLTGWRTYAQQEQIGQRTIYGVTLIDTSFPVDGDAMLLTLTNAIKWLDRKTEESITIDIYDYPHVIDFNDKIQWQGNTYYLRSNTVTVNEKIRNKQTIEMVRWY